MYTYLCMCLCAFATNLICKFANLLQCLRWVKKPWAKRSSAFSAERTWLWRIYIHTYMYILKEAGMATPTLNELKVAASAVSGYLVRATCSSSSSRNYRESLNWSTVASFLLSPAGHASLSLSHFFPVSVPLCVCVFNFGLWHGHFLYNPATIISAKLQHQQQQSTTTAVWS